MKNRFFALLTALVLVGTAASAQLKQADKLFESYSYSLAIPEYLKIAQNAKSSDRNAAIMKLADCYRLTNDQLNAKGWYAKAVKLPECPPINWFYYGQALSCAEDYDLAKVAFDTYAKLAPADPRGKAYAGFCTQIDKLTAQPAAFEVKNAKNLNSVQSDFGPSFYGEGIIYVSDRRKNFLENKRYTWTNSNYLSMLYARPRYLDEFYQDMNEPKSFAGQFNQTYHDGPATFAKHDSLIYFTRTEKGREKRDAENYRTDRLKVYWSVNHGSWSKPEPFIQNSDEYSVGHPTLTPDGNTLYFVSDMPGGFGGTDIYSCEWQNGEWSKPKNLGNKVNSFGNEMFPCINGNKLYFASDGWPGFGGLDLFVTTLTKGTWSNPENLGLPLNSSFDDFSLALDARGNKGFFSSNRPGGVGSDDIYACKRLDKKAKPCTPCPCGASGDTATLTGAIKDKQTLKPMAGSTVFLLNTMTGKVKVLKTDANGQFKSSVDKGVFYVAKGMENSYLSDCLSFEVPATDTAKHVTTPRNLLLDLLALNKVYNLDNNKLDLENIYYDFNKWNIRPDAETELDKLVQLMKENPVNIEVGSHTDSRGSAGYNMDLSQKRAESVVRYIVMQGIASARITAKGYGETELANHCTDGVFCTDTEHQANRRTTFKVIGFSAANTVGAEFDMNKFKSGEALGVYLFNRDFFISCLQDRLMTAPAETGEQKAPQAEPYTAPEKVSPPAETVKTPARTVKPAEAVKAPEKAIDNSSTDNVNVNAAGMNYRVQVYALSRYMPLDAVEFADLEDVQRYEDGGLFKYTAGNFSSSEEAHAYRDIMKDMGFGDAFVVTFKDGRRIAPPMSK